MIKNIKKKNFDICNLITVGVNWDRKGIEKSTRALRDDYLGRFVEVEGWMLFDKEHENAAENTNQGRSRNWRATAWEIHPITKITLLQRNPNF